MKAFKYLSKGINRHSIKTLFTRVSLHEKYARDNELYLRDLAQIQETTKEFALKDWNVDNQINTSALVRELAFNSNAMAVKFINYIKDKADELDHHPEWTLTNDHKVFIKLTSHFNKNNITPIDFELAAFISNTYNESKEFNPLKCKYTQKYFIYSLNLLLTLIAIYGIAYIYQLYTRYRITSDDFIFAKFKH